MVEDVRPPIHGRYQVLHELSTTLESRVFLAEDLRHTGRLCALKVFRLSSPEAFDAAKREFEVLRKLRHPGIAEVYDLGRISSQELEGADMKLPGFQEASGRVPESPSPWESDESSASPHQLPSHRLPSHRPLNHPPPDHL